MKIIQHEKYDINIEPSDWRFSAAIIGLGKYLKYHDFEFDDGYTDEIFKFKRKDIEEEKYLEFVENYYGDKMSHTRVQNILLEDSISEEQFKLVNSLLNGANTSNAVMKKVFKGIKATEENKNMILEMIQQNRNVLIKETFRHKKNMYANYANTGLLFGEKRSVCRLNGYYVDGNRKGKAISYNFDTNTFVGEDDMVFDFIPFAFYGDREAFFVNDNYSLKGLKSTNTVLERCIIERVEKSDSENIDVRRILFETIRNLAEEFIDYDVEVIVKNRERDFFETLYIRKESIEILKSIENYNSFCFSYPVNEKYYINVQEHVTNCILNLIRTDDLIELFLRIKEHNYSFLVRSLIGINMKICGGEEEMNKSMKGAYACAKEVVAKIPQNKIESYRTKLISSIVFKDYDRALQILLQLSNYSDVQFNFAYDLFEDFEDNKDIAYTFINALRSDKVNNKKEEVNS